MVVRELETEGFRNLTSGRFRPGSGVNILHGDNAQGKTNLLEAIWLFTGGRSFRGARDAELPAFDGAGASLSMTFHAQEREQEAAIRIEKRRIATLNGLSLPTASKLAGIFCAVVFSPSHLSLIKDGPEERRRFIDTAYCQLRPGYIATLAEYQRALVQRNALLKAIRKDGADPDLLDIWDRRLAEYGSRVTAARTAYCRADCRAGGRNLCRAFRRPGDIVIRIHGFWWRKRIGGGAGGTAAATATDGYCRRIHYGWPSSGRSSCGHRRLAARVYGPRASSVQRCWR